jgi:branched-chain amino acid transport system substrate-binding protein
VPVGTPDRPNVPLAAAGFLIHPGRPGVPVLTSLPLLATLAGCGGDAPEAAKEIVVGEYGSLTGTSATFGISTRNGIELATDELNSAGGIAGIKVRVVVEDDQSKPEEAATAVNKIISRDRPVAVLGEVSSSRSLAAAPLLQQAGIPMISPSSTNPKVTEVGDNIFRVCFIDPFQGTAIAQFAINQKGIKNVAILKDVKNDYSIGLAQFFTETFTRLGGTIVGEEAYSEADLDFKAQLTGIIAGNPEALFIPGYYTEVGLIARQARELGFKGAILGGDGWDSSKLVEIGQDAIVGGYYTNHYSVDDPSPLVQEFIKKYESKFHEKPDGLAALGYDAAKILYLAMGDVAKNPEQLAALADRSGVPATEAKRKAARVALKNAIAGTKGYPGVTGNITINDKRDADKPAVVVEVTRDGSRFVASIAPDGTATTAQVPPADAPAPEGAGADGAAPPAGGATADATTPAPPPAPGPN